MRPIVPIASLTRRIPEAGRIRIGKKSGNRPMAIGEFRFTSHDTEALNQIAALYGGTVRPWSDPKAAEGQHEVITDATEIRIVLPPDPLGGTPIYEMWGGGGCERRCDGVTAQVIQRGPDGPEPIDAPCICAAKNEMSCRVTTRLSVILPEVRFAGVWRLDTKSWNAAQELPGMVDMIQAAQDQGMPYATLSIKHRRTVAAGQTKKFLVPVLGTAASIEQLAGGHANLTGLTAGANPDAPALGPGTDRAGALSAGATDVAPAQPHQEGPPAPAPHHDPDDDVIDAEVVDEPPAARPAPTIPDRDDTGGPMMTGPQSKALHALLRSKHGAAGPDRFPLLTNLVGREITSTSELTRDEASRLIDLLQEAAVAR